MTENRSRLATLCTVGLCLSRISNKMKPIDYILSHLHNSAKYDLTDADRSFIGKNGVEEFIFTKFTSKKFRKWALSPDVEIHVRRAISLNYAKGEPMQCIYPFGGYKLWSMPTAPEVDWAEFFSIAYYLKYLAPIAAAYKPGVILCFSSDDAILERINNISPSYTQAYIRSFERLLEGFREYLPENVTINLFRTIDLYKDKDEMEHELSLGIESARRYYADLSDIDKMQLYGAAELNVRPNDLSIVKLEKTVVETSIAYHGAYCQLARRLAFNRSEDKITLSSVATPDAIAIGTTKNGVTKFSTGMGILERSEQGYRGRILSPSHVAMLREASYRSLLVSLFGLKNFENIMIRID
jgi:hypothetical protein